MWMALEISVVMSLRNRCCVFHVLSTGNNSLNSAYFIYVSNFVSGLEENDFSEIDPEGAHTHTIFPTEMESISQYRTTACDFFECVSLLLSG